MIEAAGLHVESVSGSWPLTTVKTRSDGALVVGPSRNFASRLFCQYVIVAKVTAG